MKSPNPSTRHDILRQLKLRGGASHAELAKHFGFSREAVRQQMAHLESRGWVKKEILESEGRGRPTTRWTLTAEGEEQFPKFYDVLTVALLRTISERHGSDGLHDLLASLTDQQVASWQSKLEGKPLERRIEALRGIYFDEDPFTTVKRSKSNLRETGQRHPLDHETPAGSRSRAHRAVSARRWPLRVSNSR